MWGFNQAPQLTMTSVVINRRQTIEFTNTMKFMRIASLLALLQGAIPAAAADGNATSCPETDKIDKPFSGVTINVLGRSFGHDYFMSKVAEWEQLTGATVNVPLAGRSLLVFVLFVH